MRRRIAAGQGVATRAMVALAAGGCAAAAAYAGTGPMSGAGAAPGAAERAAAKADPARRDGVRPPRPRITRHPEKVSTSTAARFAFRAPRRAAIYQCRLDGGRWRRCHPPLLLRGLAPGDHSFSVRAVDRRGRRGPAARFGWKLLEPKPFSIEPQLVGVGALYPGAPPQPLPLVLRNPNPVPILVTGVRVAAGADPSGCDSAANLALTPAGVSPSAPLVLPAQGSVSLPTANVAAPAIALRDLPVNQDACQGTRFPLDFSGEAHG